MQMKCTSRRVLCIITTARVHAHDGVQQSQQEEYDRVQLCQFKRKDYGCPSTCLHVNQHTCCKRCCQSGTIWMLGLSWSTSKGSYKENRSTMTRRMLIIQYIQFPERVHSLKLAPLRLAMPEP